MTRGRPIGSENTRRLELLRSMQDGDSFFEPYVRQSDLRRLRALCVSKGIGVEIHYTDDDARHKRSGCRVFRRFTKDTL